MHTPTIYTQPDCHRCRAVSKRFTARGIAHHLVDVSADPDAMARLRAAGFQAVPVFDLGDGLTDSMTAALEITRN